MTGRLARPPSVRAFYGALALVVLIGLGAAGIAFHHTRDMSRSEVSEQFRQAGRDRVDVIRLELERSLEAMRSTVGLYDASEVVDADEFSIFVSAIRRRYPGLHFMAEAPRVPLADREAFEATSVRGRPPGPVLDIEPAGERRPAGVRDEYVPILFVDPTVGHEFTIGIDLRSNPGFAASMAASEAAADVVLSGRFDVTLLKTSQTGFAVLAFQPLYANGDSSASGQGPRPVLGYLVGGYLVRDVVEKALAPLDPAGIDIWIYDRSAARSEQFLYVHASRRREATDRSDLATTDSPRFAGPQYAETIDVGSRRWELVLTPVPGIFEPDLTTSWLILAIGLAMTGGLTAHVWILARATQRLVASEQRFRDFAEASTDWLWTTDAELRFTWFSDKIEERIGIPPSAFVGKRRQELPRPPDASSDDWGTHLADLQARRPFKDFRYALTSTNGRSYDVSVSGVPVFGADGAFLGYRGTGTDVTVQVEAVRRADEALRRLNDAVESIADGWALFDREDRLVVCNTNYRNALAMVDDVLRPGVTFERIVRTLAERGFYPDAVGREDTWVAQRVADHRRKLEGEPHRVDGDRWILSREYPTAEGGTVLVRADITRLKRMEDQVRQADRMKSLGGLAAGAAHELNNALQPVLALAQMTRNSLPEGEDARENLEMIVEAAEQATAIVAQITAFAREDAGGTEATNVGESVERAVALLRKTVPSTIHLDAQVAPALCAVAGNAEDFFTVVLNLASNAVDAMAGGTGELRIVVDRERVNGDGTERVPALAAGDYTRLRVADTGRGMDEETLARVFEPFFTTKEVGEGTGMGLAVVHGIVSRCGGAVVIDSEVGRGTTVDVFLPCTDEPVAAAQAPPAVAASPIGSR